MIIFFQELVMYIILELLKMIKGILNLYSYLLGIKDIENKTNEPSVINQVLNSLDITNIFFCFLLIGLLIGTVLTIISIIKNIIKNNTKISNIIGNYISSIISIFITTIIILILIVISNSLLSLLVEIFDISYKFDVSKFILQNSIIEWNNGLLINDIDISNLTPEKFLGTYKFESYQVFPTRWNNNGIVNSNNFLFIPCLITTLITLISLLYISIKIVKRIYKIVLLYIIMPIILFTINIDNGIRFKVWCKKIIDQLFLSFIIYTSINIFYIVFNLLIKNYSINTTIFNKNLYNLIILLGGIIFIVTSSNKINIINKFKFSKQDKFNEVQV